MLTPAHLLFNGHQSDGFSVLACAEIGGTWTRDFLTDVVSAADGIGSPVRQIVACAQRLPRRSCDNSACLTGSWFTACPIFCGISAWAIAASLEDCVANG